MITRNQLEEARYEQYCIYGYKHAYCKLNSCCDDCDKRVQFGCKLINKIEDLQTKRILKICEEVNTDKGVLEKINEKQDSLRDTCKAWDEAIEKDGYVN